MLLIIEDSLRKLWQSYLRTRTYQPAHNRNVLLINVLLIIKEKKLVKQQQSRAPQVQNNSKPYTMPK